MPGRRRAVAALVVVVLAAVAVAGTVAYLRLPAPRTRDVSLPSRDATPEQVVTAHLDALDAHDCDTAEAFMVEDERDVARGWCEDVADLSDAEVGDHLLENQPWRAGASVVPDGDVVFDAHHEQLRQVRETRAKPLAVRAGRRSTPMLRSCLARAFPFEGCAPSESRSGP